MIKLIFKGFLIGIGKIMPGVSGAVIAILMGVYDKGVKAITNFFYDVKNNFNFLLCIGIGVVLAIIVGSKIIVFLLGRYEFITYMFFIGLMFYSFVLLYRDINMSKKNTFFIILGVIFSLVFLYFNKSIFVYDSALWFKYFIGGFLDGFATIFPGVSGTALLMMIGVYEDVMYALSNFYLFKSSASIMLLFGFGMISGLIVFALLINYLFKNYRDYVMSFIFGVVGVSIFSFVIFTFGLSYNTFSLLGGFLMLFLGIWIVYRLG